MTAGPRADLPASGRPSRTTAQRRDTSDGVVVVGMGCVFPGAANLDAYWRNLMAGVDAISAVPPTRWDPVYFDADAQGEPDRFYCNRGGFVDDVATFDAAAFGVMPVAVGQAEPDQLLALQTAAVALADAGGADAVGDRARIGVILGRGGYLTPGVARLDQRVRTLGQLVATLRDLVPGMREDQIERIREAFIARLGPDRPESAIDLVPNLAASRIANRLDLHGPAYTVDAACASALVAVDAAVREIEGGRCDAVVAGGVHLCHDVTLWSVFTQLKALSPTCVMRPFDRRADGLLIGEGVGVVVLMGAKAAERAGLRPYATIRGVGVSSDGRGAGLMRPSVAGQLLALERAWAGSGSDPAALGMVEAHGTATPAGDAAEIETLDRFFGRDGHKLPIGSVKSMIGHAMPAAGAAGLVKAVLAVHHGMVPPTLLCDEPHPALAGTRLTPATAPAAWSEEALRVSALRLAAVDAFGFGGINAHVIVEAHPSSRVPPARSVARRGASPGGAHQELPGGRLVLLAGERPDDLVTQLGRSRSELLVRDDRRGPVPHGPCRLAIVDATPARLDLAAKVAARGRPWQGRNGVWFSADGLIRQGGRVCFVFPGLDPAFSPGTTEVAEHFGIPAPIAKDGGDLERLGWDIVGSGRVLDAALRLLGVSADMVAGHSIGEWSGMIATEMIPPEAIDDFMASLLPGTLEVPNSRYLVAGCGADILTEVVADLAGVHVSHDNCPHQSIACGDPEGVAEAATRLKAKGLFAQELPFRSGFHSPSFAPFAAPFRAHLARLPLQEPIVPLWSATTATPYPAEAEAVRALAVRHLLEPVRFREMTERLYDAGARVFVQVGPGSVVGFVEDTLRGRPVAAVTAASRSNPGMAQLLQASAVLWVEGIDVRFSALAGSPSVTAVAPGATTGGPIQAGGDVPAAPAGRALPLGSPLVHLDADPALRVAMNPLGVLMERIPPDDPVLAAFAATVTRAVEASEAVLRELERTGRDTPTQPSPGDRHVTEETPSHSVAGEVATERVTTIVLSTETVPALSDHCFYRQPTGWAEMEDHFPVVPMTMLVELMLDAARNVVTGRLVVAVERVRALRWLAVAPPAEVTVRARATGPDRVAVTIDGYARCDVVFQDAFATPPTPLDTVLGGAHEAPVDAEHLYEDRWLFHGPAYRAVDRLGLMGDDGIRGVIANLPAPGALLDGAGQLMGFWVMSREERDRLALPTAIASIAFFGPPLSVGDHLGCTVRITELSAKRVVADMDLLAGGAVWARVTGWEDRRFDSDAVVWPVLIYPEQNTIGESRPGGYVVVREHWKDAASRELMMRRYLGRAEREEYAGKNPRAQRQWLLGRIAAKDALRRWLWDQGAGPLHPVQVGVATGPAGEPIVSGPFEADLHVSIAHRDDVAVAYVREGVVPGIDIETVVPRDAVFTDLALSPAEQRLRPETLTGDEWTAVAWAGKEAVAKADQTGLQGRMRDFALTEAGNDRLVVRDRLVRWAREGTMVVAWTPAGEEGPEAAGGSGRSSGQDDAAGGPGDSREDHGRAH